MSSVPDAFSFHPEIFDQTVELVYNSIHSQITDVIKNSQENLQKFSENVDFNYYLLLIVSFNETTEKSKFDNNEFELIGTLTNSQNTVNMLKNKQYGPAAKQSAFILLKNNVKKTFLKMSSQLQSAIKNLAIDCLSESSKPIRNMAGVLITGILSQCPNGFNNWPDFLPIIVSKLALVLEKSVAAFCRSFCRALNENLAGKKPA